MKIIVEGPECAGKSTLVEKLRQSTGFKVRHRTRPKSEEEKREMYGQYLAAITNGGNEIWDRCWYSEQVYGKIMRDEYVISMEQMYQLESYLAVYGGALIIHCTDDVERLWERLVVRGDDYINDFDTLVKLRKEYNKLFHKNTHYIPVVCYELSKNLR